MVNLDSERRADEAAAASPPSAGDGDSGQDYNEPNATDINKLMQIVHLQSSQIQSLQNTVHEQGNVIQTLRTDVQNLERWAVYSSPTYGDAIISNDDEVRNFIIKFKKQIYYDFHVYGKVHLDGPPEHVQSHFHETERLMPFFKELQRIMLDPVSSQSLTRCEETEFLLRGVTFDGAVEDILAPTLKVCHFKTLHFERNDHHNMQFFIDLIEHNPSLHTFNLMNNWFMEPSATENQEDIRRLCDAIKRHPCLKKVRFRGCGVVRRPNDLFYPLLTVSDRLKVIEVSECGVCPSGRSDLSEFLAVNTSLETLILKDNQFNDEDADLIASAMLRNTTLKWFELDTQRRFGFLSNTMTGVGREKILGTVFSDESLNAIVECNHICGFKLDGGFDDRSVINTSYSDTQILGPNTVRKIKLLTLLSAPNEVGVNIHYLERVPPGLMPRVLEFVQQYPEETYNYPDGYNTELTWSFMSGLRPVVSQDGSESRSNEDVNEGDVGDVENNEEDGEEQWGIIVEDDWSYANDDEDRQTAAQVKRLNMVFEIMRSWKEEETGEPLYVFATSRSLAHG